MSAKQSGKRSQHGPKTYKGVPSFTDRDLDEDVPDDGAAEDEEVYEIDDGFDDEEDGDGEPEDEIPVDEDAPDNSKLLSFDDDEDDDEGSEERVQIPEWNAHVVIRGLSKNEFDDIRRSSRSRPAPGGRSSGKATAPQRAGVNRPVMEREIFIAGVVSPLLDTAKYNRLVNRPGSAGVILKLVNMILEKSGLGDDAVRSEEKREKRFLRK